MKFGVSLFGDHPRTVSPDEQFETLVEQAGAARRAGFDCLGGGHHYLVEDWHRFQVMPALSRLAAECASMHIFPMFLAPLHHPVDIAERFATLDAIPGGRAIFSPVAGYRDVEFESFGIPKAERFTRLYECVELVERLWTEDDVTYDGNHFSVDGVTINHKPVQEPRPPIWIGANTDRAIMNAAKYGDAWFANPHEDTETIARQASIADTPDGDGFHGVQPGIREVFVADTDEEAVEISRTAFEDYYEWYKSEGQDDATENPTSFGAFTESRFIVGSPETVADQLVEFHERTGVDCLILSMRKPAITHEQTLYAIELAGKQVIPAVRERVED